MAISVQCTELLLGIEDNSGNALSAGKVYTYLAGTTTPAALYTDYALTIPATNPIILDTNGMAQVYASGNYKFIIKTAADATLYTWDNLVFDVADVSASIADGSITFAKIQDIATDRILGRDSAATGDVESLTVSGGLEFSGAIGIQRSALTGDVTAAAGSNATTIAADAVTSTKLRFANNTPLRMNNLAGTVVNTVILDASDNLTVGCAGQTNIQSGSSSVNIRNLTGGTVNSWMFISKDMIPNVDNDGNVGSATYRAKEVFTHSISIKPTLVTAAGTTQGDATALTARMNVVTAGGATTGVKLPTGSEGMIVCVAFPLASTGRYIYPVSGSQINALGVNAAYDPTNAGYRSATLIATSATQWYVIGA